MHSISISTCILYTIIVGTLAGGPLPKKYPLIKTKYGPIRGVVKFSREGRPYASFTKIPYAQPPIGENRFKGPKYLEPWEDVLETQEDPPMCIQKNYWASKNPVVEGQEDCLFLNVYTPKLPPQEGKRPEPLPVMVYIHQGGFSSGYSGSQFLGPEYFMDQDVILVTFNYRLGILGFLSTGDDASPGNWGLKDQVAVLRWVNSNIEQFSGNNEMVTIFGQSAGSSCVHFHLLSPLSKRLFHRAISQSGSALNLWAHPNNKVQRYYARATGILIGCGDTDTGTTEMVTCLRNKSASELVDSISQLKFFEVEPIVIFGPALEEKTPQNPRPFLSRDPTEKIKNQEFHKVPWMVGVVEDEGIIRAASLLRAEQTRTVLNANFDSLLPPMLGLPYSVTASESEKIWRDMKKFYWGGANVIDSENAKHVKGFTDMMSDRGVTYGVYQGVLLHASRGHKPIYFYNFSYKGAFSYADYFAGTTENIDYKWGTCHTDELLYLFRTPALFPDLATNSSDLTMSKIMVKLWANFARYGDPTPNAHIKDTIWEKMEDLSQETSFLQSQYLRYLNISGSFMPIYRDNIKLQNQNCFIAERLKFLESLELTETVVK